MRTTDSDLFDVRLEAFLWCTEVTVIGELMTIQETFDFREANALPVEFEGFAFLKFRGRELPDSMAVQLQFRSLDNDAISPRWNLDARPGREVGGWQRVVCLAAVQFTLEHPEQTFSATIPEIGAQWDLPLSIVV